MTKHINSFFNILDKAGEKEGLFKLATIDLSYPNDGNKPTLIFDGETKASAKAYPFLDSYIPRAGDRVILAKQGRGWVIIGGLENGSDFLPITGGTVDSLGVTNNATIGGTLDVTGAFTPNGGIYDPPFTTLTLANGWANYGGAFAPAGYKKNVLGEVVLRGLIKSGTAATIATLPAGYRPGYTHGATVNTGVSTTFCRVDISTAGIITAQPGYSNGWVFLDNIRFKAEN